MLVVINGCLLSLDGWNVRRGAFLWGPCFGTFIAGSSREIQFTRGSCLFRSDQVQKRQDQASTT